MIGLLAGSGAGDASLSLKRIRVYGSVGKLRWKPCARATKVADIYVFIATIIRNKLRLALVLASASLGNSLSRRTLRWRAGRNV